MLGEGACGVVYTVTNGTENSIPYAIVAKVIPLGRGTGKALKESTRTCNTLNYENTLYNGVLRSAEIDFVPRVPMRGYGDDVVHGVRYLLMERMDQDLTSFARSVPPPSASAIASIGLQILSGLQKLHRRGFLFVDVKPGNFMLVGDALRFVDFGLVESWRAFNGSGVRPMVCYVLFCYVGFSSFKVSLLFSSPSPTMIFAINILPFYS